jgi:hypothetical protein
MTHGLHLIDALLAFLAMTLCFRHGAGSRRVPSRFDGWSHDCLTRQRVPGIERKG